MISVGTYLDVSDNSGAKIAQCIRILSKQQGHFATVGDVIVVTIKKANSKYKGKATAGQVYRGVILETKKEVTRKDGSLFSFDRNVVALMTPQENPMGTRITGFASYELRAKGKMKFIALSSSSF
uniref:Ribosomal protein L14 n=1 Tax=Nephroselmis olivacea TaxID=31312 RepID=Q9TCB2_NEPOL|nr:ribosomal protein L14 [Nephroselmis olivacea]AAF03185.1 ribosomal protein L14 [Nephroselmis olivacea]